MPTTWYKAKNFKLKQLLLPGLFFAGKHLSIKNETFSLHLKKKYSEVLFLSKFESCPVPILAA